jgi:hypothetical protein
LNLPNFALAPIRASGMGFYSYLFRYMYTGAASEPFIGRCETLRTDFLGFLERSGVQASAELREFVQTANPRNTSQHGDWRGYYDQALADAVAKHDATVIERFNYAFTA